MAIAGVSCSCSQSVSGMVNFSFPAVGMPLARGTNGRIVGSRGSVLGRERSRRGVTGKGYRRRDRQTVVRAADDGGVDQEESTASRGTKLPEKARSKTSVVAQKQQRPLSKRGRKQPVGSRSPWKFPNLIEELSGFMAPREKGDVRDVVLMSLSFAVFIYISQHLVHAYCTLRHMYHF